MSKKQTRKPKIIIGVDEAGRGPLAGPVIACAITVPAIFNLQFPISKKNKNQIKDSKQLTAKQRDEVYQFVQNSPEVVWAVGRAGERVIDKINILEASKLAMKRAVLNLEKKLGQPADLLLIDGNFTIPVERKQKSIIKGDEKVPLISLASIIAKVNRDKMMRNYHRKYPEYGFQQHKGYPTKQHIIKIANCGPCQIHRTSFSPVAKLLQK